ncbi:MAG TPA: AI-2E family transporter [Candidatus Aminicenantes bacterium]|nr:AI-2E family transporter [Candidatus Aminicenantes bacterium]
MDDRRYFGAALAVVALFLTGCVLKIARPVLIPFILAVFLSFLIDPALGLLTRCRCPRPWATALVLALMFVALYLFGVLAYSSGKALVAELPKYQGRLADIAAFLGKGLGPFKVDLSAALRNLDIDRAGALILGAIGPFLGLVGKLLLVFLFLVAIVAGRGRLGPKIAAALGEARAGRARSILASIDAQVRKYLVLKTAVSLANGVMVWIVLACFGVDFAAFFGLAAFLLNYIPNIGSAIATVLRVGFAFFQFGTFWTPFWVLVVANGLDLVLGNVVEPRIMGKGLGLSPLIVFFSLVFWGWLWGIPGMILSVPLTALVKIVCQNVPALRPAAVLMGS